VVTRSSAVLVGEVPTAFAQLSVYEAMPVADGVTVFEPLVASAPLHAPDAVQPVALMADQLSVVGLPTVTVFTARFNVGAPGANCASAAPAWMNPYPESKFGVAEPMPRAVFCSAE
jgi:hypothetical protein